MQAPAPHEGPAEMTPVEPDPVRTGEGMSYRGRRGGSVQNGSASWRFGRGSGGREATSPSRAGPGSAFDNGGPPPGSGSGN